VYIAIDSNDSAQWLRKSPTAAFTLSASHEGAEWQPPAIRFGFPEMRCRESK